MTFIQFLSILRARYRIALAVLILTIGLTVGVSLLLPKQYTAYASVVVDFKPDPVSTMMYAGMPSPGYTATQVDIMQSDRVAQRVVRDLKLADNPEVRQQWLEATQGRGDIVVWLAETFQKKMDVKPSRESNVITVSYKAPDPQFAAGLANAFVRAYLKTTLELRVDPAKQYSSFFDTRSKDAREALERAQTKLSEFQMNKGIVVTDERLDVENSRLSELSSQLVLIQALASESGSRQSQAKGASADRMQEVLGNPVVGSLKADISRAEAKLQEMGARLGDNNPQVVEAKANIAGLRSRMDAEIARVVGGVGVSDTINRQREADVRASLDAQRAKVLQLKAIRDEGAVLTRDVESAQLVYQTVVTRFNQSTLESQTTQSNINVLTEATPPIEPSFPRLLLMTLAATVVGSLLAVGVALVLEMIDRRVRSADDVLVSLGLPVIGFLPRPNSKKLVGRLRPTLMQQRMVGRLAAPGKGV